MSRMTIPQFATFSFLVTIHKYEWCYMYVLLLYWVPWEYKEIASCMVWFILWNKYTCSLHVHVHVQVYMYMYMYMIKLCHIHVHVHLYIVHSYGTQIYPPPHAPFFCPYFSIICNMKWCSLKTTRGDYCFKIVVPNKITMKQTSISDIFWTADL